MFKFYVKKIENYLYLENEYPDVSIYVNLNCNVYENKLFVDTNDNNDEVKNFYTLNNKNRNKIILEDIKGPFYNNHFYYVNNNMCRVLINNLKVITYQLDIEIGLLMRKLFSIGISNVKFKYFCNDIIIQNITNFQSEIQFYRIKFWNYQ